VPALDCRVAALLAMTETLRDRPEINALIRSKISEPYQNVKVIEFDHLSPDGPLERTIAREKRAATLRVDVIEQALRSSGMHGAAAGVRALGPAKAGA